MTGSLLQVALSGIQAAQLGLNTTSHNIANVNTPNYNRQVTSQSSTPPVYFGAGFAGSGVRVDAITRSYSDLLTGQLRAAESQSTRSTVYAQTVDQLNSFVGDSNGSVTGAMSDFFGALQLVTTSPGDAAARQAVYASAQSVVQRFRGVDRNLTQLRDDINQRAENLVTDINSRTQEIADLGTRIVAATASGRPPNDLLDQRDAMLGELNRLARISVTAQADGSISVYLGNGQALLNGSIAQKLAMAENPLETAAPTLGVKSGSIVVSLAGNGEVGGELGGLLSARDEALTSVTVAVGRMARVFTDAINERNHLGIDPAGNAGGDIFAIDPPVAAAAASTSGSASIAVTIIDAHALKASDYRVDATASGYTVTRLSDSQQQAFASAPITIDGLRFDVTGAPTTGDRFGVRAVSDAVSTLRLAIGDATKIASASSLRIDSLSANKGTGVASVAIDSDDPALHDAAQLVFDGAGQVTITTAAGSTVLAYTAGTPIVMNGWSVYMRGTPAAGDTFQLDANTNTDGDNRNAVALAALETSEMVPGMSFNGMYAALVVDIGTKGREAAAARDANEGLATSVGAAREAISGVNLDEEALNLMSYQQAYQAAGRMIGIANNLFDTILSISS